MKNDKTDCAHYWVHAHSELINASKKCKRCGLEQDTKFHNVETTYWGLQQPHRLIKNVDWDKSRKRGQAKRHGK